MEQFENHYPGRILYFDTDSLIFVARDTDEWKLETGHYLGDLVSELKPGQHIEKFVSLGAKSYAYRTNDGKHVTKIKGFTLNGETEELINFTAMLHLLDEKESTIAVPQRNLRRDIKTVAIKEVQTMKKCRFYYKKCVILDGPFGFCAD
ncbi:hypothetical protein BV898_06551 [Hypsibius exemplaris]|uniref:DNA-directed DNA polymerase n=1 Tax=Hypsibius exemplaris TaxID=2072580 RepID=A0A1W0WW88_HYPEX|nr:hypothetical protein BV898_06551 [Hypsibius exemplaris]